jgi:hypothetical protein
MKAVTPGGGAGRGMALTRAVGKTTGGFCESSMYHGQDPRIAARRSPLG